MKIYKILLLSILILSGLTSCSGRINKTIAGNSFGELALTEGNSPVEEMVGIQTVILKINLEDHLGNPVSSARIDCNCNRGAVNNFVFTDSLGVAFIKYLDIKPITTNSENAQIPDYIEVTIEYKPFNLDARLRLISFD